MDHPPPREEVPATLRQTGAAAFWLVVVLTGVATGIAAAVLTSLLEVVQHLMWPGPGTLLDAAENAGALRHILVLLAAGVATGAGQLVLRRLSSGKGIDITAAIWFHAGRLPPLRTLGSAILSVVIVGTGASLGREGAPSRPDRLPPMPLCDRAHLSDEQRRLLVACGAGAGMAAAYGVPLGGALFAVEVLRGALSLRLVLPAIVASLVATGCLGWRCRCGDLSDPDYHAPLSIAVWAVVAGPIAGVVSVGYVRAIAWADHHKPKGWQRLLAPTVALGLLGLVSICSPNCSATARTCPNCCSRTTAPFAVMLALLRAKASSDFAAPGKRRAGRPLHPLAHDGGAAGRRAGARLVVVLARRCAG